MEHTRATHGHLLEGVGIPAPPCHYCNEEIVTVKHIFTSCPVLRRERVIFFKDETPELKDVIGDGKVARGLVPFLKHIRFYDVI